MDRSDTLSKKNATSAGFLQRLNLRVVLAVRAALQVDYPSDQEEQEAHAEQHGGLLVDVRQLVRIDHNPPLSASHPLEQRGGRDEDMFQFQ